MIDALAHLGDPRVADAAAMLERASAVGVTDVVNGSALPTPGRHGRVRVWRAAGLHPQTLTADLPIQLQTLERQLDAPGTKALGEIGLDARNGMPSAALQEEALMQQLRLAAARRLPVILHCVQRIGRLLELLADAPPIAGMLHAFAGPAELVPKLVDLGLSFSFGGLVGRPEARRCHAALLAVPGDRLLLETDTPDHALPGHFHSEPAMLAPLVATVARLRQTDPADIAACTAANARRLYNLPLGSTL